MYQLIPIAAIVPNIVATAADVKATMKLLRSAAHSGSESKKSFLYHSSENPVKELPFPSLKEYAIITKRGKKRKISVITKIVNEKEKVAFL